MNEREKVEYRRNNIIILIAFAAVPAIYALVLLTILAARHWKIWTVALAVALLCCAGCRVNEEKSKKIDPPAQVLTEEEAGRALQRQFNGL